MSGIHPDMCTPIHTGVVFIMERDIITGPGTGITIIPVLLPMAIMCTIILIQVGDFRMVFRMAGWLMDGTRPVTVTGDRQVIVTDTIMVTIMDIVPGIAQVIIRGRELHNPGQLPIILPEG